MTFHTGPVQASMHHEISYQTSTGSTTVQVALHHECTIMDLYRFHCIINASYWTCTGSTASLMDHTGHVQVPLHRSFLYLSCTSHCIITCRFHLIATYYTQPAEGPVLVHLHHNVWYRAGSRFAPSQWETALLCIDVSHWLCTNLESALW